ncbi:MAG TPA: hypothetical protein ENH85_01970 [Candidatus Scalindua sp.]|nr:hypothetical protein [Candidatus Scalindua sp.]
MTHKVMYMDGVVVNEKNGYPGIGANFNEDWDHCYAPSPIYPNQYYCFPPETSGGAYYFPSLPSFRPTEKAVAIVKALTKKGLLRYADIGEGLLEAIETIIEVLE